MIAARVLIQGGGIGGLVAAAALAQRGGEVDVVEHRPAASVLGVGLIQPPNALRVMADIGVLDDCRGLPGRRLAPADVNVHP